MKNQKGFTLIELIIVIVILGILAVTAAPQFLNFSTDARKATLEGLQGSVKAAADIVYGKSLIAGNNTIGKELCGEDGDEACVAGGFEVAYGYPVAVNSTTGAAGEFATIIDAIQNADWDVASSATDPETTFSELVALIPTDSVAIYPAGLPTATWTATKGCFVLYTEADATATPPTTTPTVKVISTDC